MIPRPAKLSELGGLFVGGSSMRIPETAYKLFVWGGAAVVGAAFLLWLSEIIVGLVLIVSVLYTAIHLLTRFGEWYTGTYVSDDRVTRAPSVLRSSPHRRADPSVRPQRPAMTPSDQDLSGTPDEATWQPDWQLDAARAQELDDYYRDDEWEAEESRQQAAEEAMDGAAEGLGRGEDEDGRW